MPKYYQAPGFPASFRFFVPWDFDALIEASEVELRSEVERLATGACLVVAARFEHVVAAASQQSGSTLLPSPAQFETPIMTLRRRPDGALETRFLPAERFLWERIFREHIEAEGGLSLVYFQPSDFDRGWRWLLDSCRPGAVPLEIIEPAERDDFDLFWDRIDCSDKALESLPPALPRLRDDCCTNFAVGADRLSDFEFGAAHQNKKWRISKPSGGDLTNAFLRTPLAGHRFIRLATLGARPKSVVIAIPIKETDAINRATDAELSYCWRQAALLGARVREAA